DHFLVANRCAYFLNLLSSRRCFWWTDSNGNDVNLVHVRPEVTGPFRVIWACRDNRVRSSQHPVLQWHEKEQRHFLPQDIAVPVNDDLAFWPGVEQRHGGNRVGMVKMHDVISGGNFPKLLYQLWGK